MDHWLEQTYAQLVHHEGSIRRRIDTWADALPLGFVSLPLDSLRQRQRNKEGNVLFNDALNTFYLRLYGIK